MRSTSSESGTRDGKPSARLRRATARSAPICRRPYRENAGSKQNCPSKKRSPRKSCPTNRIPFRPTERRADANRSPDRPPSDGSGRPSRAASDSATSRTRCPSAETAPRASPRCRARRRYPAGYGAYRSGSPYNRAGRTVRWSRKYNSAMPPENPLSATKAGGGPDREAYRRIPRYTPGRPARAYRA